MSHPGGEMTVDDAVETVKTSIVLAWSKTTRRMRAAGGGIPPQIRRVYFPVSADPQRVAVCRFLLCAERVRDRRELR